MKKLLLLLTFSLTIFAGCSKQETSEEVIQKVQEFYNNIELASFIANINTHIYDNTADFEIEFHYNKYSDDEVVVVKPDSISGLKAYITKFEGKMNLIFEDLQLETLLAENEGVNPCDVVSFAIFDLQNSVPISISTDDELKIMYKNGEISKQVFLNQENYDIIRIECFINGEMVIEVTVD